MEELFKVTTQYLCSLRESPNGRKVAEASRKTGFLGFLFCMQSLLALFNYLVLEKKFVKYIPAHKICQAHLEHFFGLIRAHGGHKDNPNTQQFRAAFKKVIIQNELSDVATGNCLILDNVSILTCSSATVSPTHLLNSLTQRKRTVDCT